MSSCRQATITNAAFANLCGVHTLDIHGAGETITAAAFALLHGIHALTMIGCHQATITDAALVQV
jgi:hypothetical protein